MRFVLALVLATTAVAYANPVEPQGVNEVRICLLEKVEDFKNKALAFHLSVVDRVDQFSRDASESETADKVKAAVEKLQANIMSVVESIVRLDFFSVRGKVTTSFVNFRTDMDDIISHADEHIKPKVMQLINQFKAEAVEMGKIFMTDVTMCITKMFQ